MMFISPVWPMNSPKQSTSPTMMTYSDRKPRLCLALPGIHYYPQTTYVLNTRPLIPYLAEDFDVTLVFRKNLVPPESDARYVTLLNENQLSAKEQRNRSFYFTPMHLGSAWRYERILNQFAQTHADAFDVVIERQWSLVGSLASAFERQGVPSLFILEAEFYGSSQQTNLIRRALKSMLDRTIPHLRRKWIQAASGIILETDEMKSFLLAAGYPIASKLHCSIPNGIDPDIFFPRNQHDCRRQLGIAPDKTVLTYVGSLNRFIQEPGPLIEALGQVKRDTLELHVIGDGTKRHELEAIAHQYAAPVVFHGRTTQAEAACYIGASDLCVAPYNKSLFPQDRFTSASIKVCEYLGCGRPVLTIPCERMTHLLDQEAYGFMVENDTDSYLNFFNQFPGRDRLSHIANLLTDDLQQSVLRDKEIVFTWREIADLYKRMIWATLSKSPGATSGLLAATHKRFVEAS